MKKVGVLASGTGTNLQAILDAIEREEVSAEVSIVISDREEAVALRRAQKRGIENLFLDPQKNSSRREFESAIVKVFQEREVQLVALAGFMRVLSPFMIASYPQRIMNIHPSLLPAFPGLEAVKQALDYGVKVTGCTVHFVDEGMDTGPIILQEAVTVLQNDSVETLQQRIHAAEHRIYPRAIDLFCKDKIKVIGRRCYLYENENREQ